MKVIIQRVTSATVRVDNEIVSQINKGFLLLVGITHSDNQEIVDKVAKKVSGLRIFEDNDGKMNLSLADVGGEILSVSQFTLYADVKKGRRPSFVDSARPEMANPLYLYFNKQLENQEIVVKQGIFQADMQIELINDGPVTIIVDSDNL